jgi:hypothetical protein
LDRDCSTNHSLLAAACHARLHQQRIVNLDVPVVIDQAKLAKLVHETADAGSVVPII